MASAFNLTAQINLRGPTNLKPIVADIKRQLGSVTTNVTVKLDNRSAKSIDTVTSRLKSMDVILTRVNANAKSLQATFRDLSASLANIQNAGNTAASGINKASQSMQQTSKNIRVARTEMEEFGKQSFLAIKRFAAFSIVTSGVFALTSAITSGFKAFIQFDKELIKLQQVTGKGSLGIKELEKQITNLATTLGVSSESLTSVASTLAQAGLSAEDTRIALSALAKTELAPSFDNLTDTTEGAIAALRQFELQAGDLESALGSINAVAAAFAVESKDIISAIQRTGGVFASASKGVSEGKDALNEFIAVFTSVRATTRESAETIATGLRTIFTRVQRSSTIQLLKDYGVELRDLENKFVGPFEAVKRLSSALNQLDPRSASFSKIVEELGGFRQIGKVIPLIQQFATAQEALSIAQKGQSSLTDAQVVAQKSLANQIAKVREQFLALVRDIGQSSVFQGFFKIVVGLTSGLLNLASAFKPILPVLGILAAVKGVSAIGQFATGFFGGLKKGGGSRGAGENIGSSLSGGKEKDRADATNRAAESIRLNTDALKGLTSAVTSLENTIRTRGGSSTLNSGGKVTAFARGGFVPGSGNRDTVPAMLMPGEFVIRKKAVEKLGAGNLQDMNKYAGGGYVQKFKNGSKRGVKGRTGARSKFRELDETELAGLTTSDLIKYAKAQARDIFSTSGAGIATASEFIEVSPEKIIPELEQDLVTYMGKRGFWREKISPFGQAVKQSSASSDKARRKKALERQVAKQADEVAAREQNWSAIQSGSEVDNYLLSSLQDPVLTDYKTVRSGKSLDKPFHNTRLRQSVNKVLEEYDNFDYSNANIDKFVSSFAAKKFAYGGLVQKFMAGSEGPAGVQKLSIQEELIERIKQLKGPASAASLAFSALSDVEKRAYSIKDPKNIQNLLSNTNSRLLNLKGDQLIKVKDLVEKAERQKQEKISTEINKKKIIDDNIKSGNFLEFAAAGLQYGGNFPKTSSIITPDTQQTIKLHSGSLNKKQGKKLERKVFQDFRESIKNVSTSLAGSIKAKPDLSKLDSAISEAGFYNVVGAALESAVGVLIGKPYTPKTEESKSIDFIDGLGSAANIFDIPNNVPTDVTRTLGGYGKSVNDMVGQIDRYLKNYKKLPSVNAKNNGGIIQKFKLGGKVYDLQKGTGLSNSEFDQLVQYGNTNNFSEKEFTDYLAQHLQRKNSKKNLMMNTSQLLGVLKSGTNTPPTSSKQMDLAKQLMGSPDAKYNPKYDNARKPFAKGGSAEDTVPALLTPGEFVINKSAAKRIGYARLNRMNKADKIQGYNRGGLVGGIQMLASGGKATDRIVDMKTRREELEAQRKELVKKSDATTDPIQKTLLKDKINSIDAEMNDLQQTIDLLINRFDTLSTVIENSTQKQQNAQKELDNAEQAVIDRLKKANFGSGKKWEDLSDAEKQKATKAAMSGKITDSSGTDVFESENKAIAEAQKRLDRATKQKKSFEQKKQQGYGDLKSSEDVKTSILTAEEKDQQRKSDKAYLDYKARKEGISESSYRYGLAQKLGKTAFETSEMYGGRTEEMKQELVLKQRSLAGVGSTIQSLQTKEAKGGVLTDAEQTQLADAQSRLAMEAEKIANEMKSLNPTLDMKAVTEASKEIATSLSSGKLEEAQEKLVDVLGKAPEGPEAMNIAMQKLAEEAGISVDVLKREFGSGKGAKQIQQQQFIQSREGQRFGALAEFAPGLTQAFSKTIVGKGLGSAADFISGKGGKFSKAFSGIGGIAGIGSGVAVGAEMLKNYLPKSVTSNPNVAGALGGLSGAGSGAATGAMIGSFAGPIGTLIGGIGGAVIGGVKGYFSAKNTQILTNALDKVSQSASKLSSAFDLLEKEGSNVNYDAAQKAFGNFLSASQDINNIALTAQNTNPLDLTAIPEEQRSEARNQMIQNAQTNIQSAAVLSQQSANRTSSDDLAKALKELENNTISVLPTIKAYQDAAIKAAEEQNGAAVDLTNIQKQNISSRVAEQAAIDAYITKRKQAGATEEQIDKMLAESQAEVIKQGNEIIRQNDILAKKQQLLSRAMKEVDVISESLANVFKRIAAGLTRFAQSIDKVIGSVERRINDISGNASIGRVDRTNEQILSNITGFSMDEVKGAAGSLNARLGGGEDVTKLTNTILASKTISEQLPELLRTTQPEKANDIVGILKGTVEQITGGPVSGAIKEALDKAQNTIESKVEGEGQVSLSELAQDSGFLDKFNEILSQGAETAANLEKARNDALDRSIELQNKWIDVMTISIDYSRKAAQIGIESQLELRKTLGQTLSLDELNAPETQSISRMTGGITDPRGIAKNIKKLQDEIGDEIAGTGLLGERTRILSQPQGEQSDAFKKNTEALKVNRLRLNDNINALKKLADSSSKASNALSKIQEQQNRGQSFIGLVKNLATGGFQNRFEAMQKFGALKEGQQALSNNDLGFFANELKFTKFQEGLGMVKDVMLPEKYQELEANSLKAFFRSQGFDLKQEQAGFRDTFGVKNLEELIDKSVKGKAPEDDPLVREYKAAAREQQKANEELRFINKKIADNITAASTSVTDSLAQKLPEIVRDAFKQARADIAGAVQAVGAANPGAPVPQVAVPGAFNGAMVDGSPLDGTTLVNYKPKGKDRYPYMLAKGEAVISAHAAKKNPKVISALLNKQTIEPSYAANGDVVGENAPKPRTRASINKEIEDKKKEIQGIDNIAEQRLSEYETSGQKAKDEAKLAELEKQNNDATTEMWLNPSNVTDKGDIEISAMRTAEIVAVDKAGGHNIFDKLSPEEKKALIDQERANLQPMVDAYKQREAEALSSGMNKEDFIQSESKRTKEKRDKASYNKFSHEVRMSSKRSADGFLSDEEKNRKIQLIRDINDLGEIIDDLDMAAGNNTDVTRDREYFRAERLAAAEMGINVPSAGFTSDEWEKAREDPKFQKAVERNKKKAREELVAESNTRLAEQNVVEQDISEWKDDLPVQNAQKPQLPAAPAPQPPATPAQQPMTRAEQIKAEKQSRKDAVKAEKERRRKAFEENTPYGRRKAEKRQQEMEDAATWAKNRQYKGTPEDAVKAYRADKRARAASIGAQYAGTKPKSDPMTRGRELAAKLGWSIGDGSVYYGGRIIGQYADYEPGEEPRSDLDALSMSDRDALFAYQSQELDNYTQKKDYERNQTLQAKYDAENAAMEQRVVAAQKAVDQYNTPEYKAQQNQRNSIVANAKREQEEFIARAKNNLADTRTKDQKAREQINPLTEKPYKDAADLASVETQARREGKSLDEFGENIRQRRIADRKRRKEIDAKREADAMQNRLYAESMPNMSGAQQRDMAQSRSGALVNHYNGGRLDLEDSSFSTALVNELTSGRFLARAASTGVDLLPGIGTLKGATEAYTGIDAVTGEELSTLSRVASGGAAALSLVPLAGGSIGGSIKSVAKGSARGIKTGAQTSAAVTRSAASTAAFSARMSRDAVVSASKAGKEAVVSAAKSGGQKVASVVASGKQKVVDTARNINAQRSAAAAKKAADAERIKLLQTQSNQSLARSSLASEQATAIKMPDKTKPKVNSQPAAPAKSGQKFNFKFRGTDREGRVIEDVVTAASEEEAKLFAQDLGVDKLEKLLRQKGYSRGGKVGWHNGVPMPGLNNGDDTLATLKRGEGVVNAASYAKYGSVVDAINRSKGGPLNIPGFLNGTPQQSGPLSSSNNYQITLDSGAQSVLDSLSSTLNSFGTNFGAYVNQLSQITFPVIPDKIELTGNYQLQVQITGAAALEALDSRMKELAVSLVEPKIEQLRNEVSAATNGTVKPSAAQGMKK